MASSSLAAAAAFLLPLLLGVPSFLAFSASFLASLFFLARSAFSFSSISLFSFSMREMRVLHLQEKMASMNLHSHLLHIFNSLKINVLYVVVAHITYLLCSSIAVLDLMNQSNRNCGAFLTAALWNEYR